MRRWVFNRMVRFGLSISTDHDSFQFLVKQNFQPPISECVPALSVCLVCLWWALRYMARIGRNRYSLTAADPHTRLQCCSEEVGRVSQVVRTGSFKAVLL